MKAMPELVKAERFEFGTLVCDVYRDKKNQDKFYMTREQIGSALEYSNPMIAIQKIHDRHKERMDKFSLTKMVNGRLTYFYNAKGIYEICRHSDKPKANEFYDAVYEVLEGLRLGYLKLKVELDSPIWADTRALGKQIRKEESDAIKALVDYARGQGSQHAGRYYISLSRLADASAGITDRDTATVMQLNSLLLMERLIAKEIQAGINKGAPYWTVYKSCKERLSKFAAITGLQDRR